MSLPYFSLEVTMYNHSMFISKHNAAIRRQNRKEVVEQVIEPLFSVLLLAFLAICYIEFLQWLLQH